MLATIFKTLTFLICLSFFKLAYAQNPLGSGRLLVQAPSNAMTCGLATVQWLWTGSSYDAMSHVLSIAVIQSDGDSSGSTFKKRNIEEQVAVHGRSIKRNVSNRMIRLQPRALGVEISSGQNVPMSDESWVWEQVTVPPGTYQMAITVVGASLTVMSGTFTVSQGYSTTCLGNNADSTFTVPTQSSTQSTTNNAASSYPVVSNSTTTSNGSVSSGALSSTSAAQTPAITSSAPVSNGSQAQENTDSSGSGESHSSSNNDGGKIAAGILVPLLAIVGVIGFFYCCRKRKINEASEHRQGWSEKAITLLNRGKSTKDGPTHGRTISHPTNPIHSAGLTQHDDNIRGEMIEAREGCTPSQSVRVMSPIGSGNNEHWVDFAGETDACPITHNHLNEIVRVSMEQSHSDLADDSTMDSGRIQSNSSAQSSLPAYLRDVRSPAPSFGQEANGQPIVVIKQKVKDSESDRRSSQSSTQMHDLSRNGSVTSNDTVTVERKNSVRNLTRNDSKSSVRRKPVPRISITSEAIVSDEHGPFADDKEEISSPKNENISQGSPKSAMHLVSEEFVPPIQNHLSIVSGRTIGEDQLNELLDGETEILRTPRHSSNADVPESVHASPMSIRKYSPKIDGENDRISKFSSSPLRFENSENRNSHLSSDEAQKNAWKLSIRLQDQDRGFRVSFPATNERNEE